MNAILGSGALVGEIETIPLLLLGKSAGATVIEAQPSPAYVLR
jgi:hypothetical protein